MASIIEKYLKPARTGFVGKILDLILGVKDAKFDETVKEKVNALLPQVKTRAINKLGLDPSEAQLIKPITFAGHNYDSDTKVKQGKDGKWRSNAYQVTWLFFTKDQICAYKISFFIEGTLDKGAESTEEYFYKDITNFSTSSGVIDVAGSKVQSNQFSIVVPGDKFSCWVNDNIDAQVQAMKKLLREKKAG